MAALLALAVASATARESELRVTGIVVDEHRIAQPGVEVTAFLRGEERVVTTAADGRFDVRFAARDDGTEPWASVHARADGADGEVGASASVYADGAQPALVVLRPLTAATFTVRLAGEPAPGVALQWRTGSKYSRVLLKTFVSDAAGNVVVRGPSGTYSLLVSDARYAAEERPFSLPREDPPEARAYDPWRVDLDPARTLRVRVTDAASGAPVEGARVWRQGTRGSGYDDPAFVRTDPRGEVVLGRLPTGRIGIGAFVESPRATGSAEVTVGQTPEVEIRVTREQTHTVRWPIDSTGVALAEGTDVVFRMQAYRKQPDRPARIEDGHVVLREYPEASDYGYAVADERHAALLRYELQQQGGSSVPRSLLGTFLTAKPVVLRLLDARGEPVAGQPVLMEGWFLLRDAQGRLTRQHVHGDTTDAEGRIAWDGMFWEPARVKLLPGPASAAERPLGVLDAGSGAEEHVFRLGERRSVELHVTLDGVPGLRSDLSIHCDGTVSGYAADGRTGRVEFPVSLGAQDRAVPLSVSAGGFTTWSTALDGSSLPEGESLRFDVPLRTVVTLAVVLDPKPDGYVPGEDVQLHGWDESRARWTLESYRSDAGHGAVLLRLELEEQGIECWHAFPGLAAGRYRLVHAPTGSTTGPFEVSATPAVQTVRFAIPRTRRVTGRLAGAEGISPSDALLEHTSAAAGLDWDTGTAEPALESRQVGHVNADGTFEVTIPAVATTIRVRHPLLRTAEFTLPADAVAPVVVSVQKRIVLEIPYVVAEGPASSVGDTSSPYDFHSMTPRARMEEEQRARAWDGPPFVRIRREADGRVTWPLLQRIRPEGESTLLVGFDEPGTHTLLLEVADRVPVLLPEVKVPAERSRIAPVGVPRGSSVEVAVRAPSRNPLGSARAHVVGTPKGELPETRRDASADGGQVLLLAGLPAGTYRLHVDLAWKHRGLEDAPESVEQVVVVDGVTDRKVEIDARPARER